MSELSLFIIHDYRVNKSTPTYLNGDKTGQFIKYDTESQGIQYLGSYNYTSKGQVLEAIIVNAFGPTGGTGGTG